MTSRAARHFVLFAVFLIICILAYNECEAKRKKGCYGVRKHYHGGKIYGYGGLHKHSIRVRVRHRHYRKRFGRIRFRRRRLYRRRFGRFRRYRKIHVLHPVHPIHPVFVPRPVAEPPYAPSPLVHIHIHNKGRGLCKRRCGIHAHCYHGRCVCDSKCHGNPYIGCAY